MLNKKNVLRLMVLIIAVFIVSSVVYAAHVTINTDDGLLDANWTNVTVIDSSTGVTPDYDIDDAWVGTDANPPSAFFFRVSLAPGGQLPSDYDSLEARLDCNQDGDFTDPQDVVVYYALDTFLVDAGNPHGEEIVECQGSDYIDCTYSAPNTSDLNLVSFGEEISGSPYNYEWRADLTGGLTNWSACLGSINVQFASVDATGQEQDLTLWQGYSTPNSVTLSSFVSKIPLLGTAITIALSVVVVSGLVLLQAKKKH